ncbi:MAG: hypothetical protein GF392_04085 [Candidatus Omnitrophica bacterium]|nr:hypothetical protein [Candidatus Omnitrophota bacterium]
MIAYLLIVLGLFLRVTPHVPNTAPIVAIALFAGTVLNRRVVPWVPLAIIMISDVLIGLHDMVLFTWGAFLLIGFLGLSLRKNSTPLRIAGYTIGSAVLFFFISNIGVYFLWYPLTLRGLADCFIRAVPFFRNTLVSNIIFSFALFGIYELAGRLAGETRYSRILLAD